MHAINEVAEIQVPAAGASAASEPSAFSQASPAGPVAARPMIKGLLKLAIELIQ